MRDTEQTTKRDYVARMIAETFKAEAEVKRYRNVCKKYALAVVLRAFAEAKSVPEARVKKSRPAIFFHLIKKYANERREDIINQSGNA